MKKLIKLSEVYELKDSPISDELRESLPRFWKKRVEAVELSAARIEERIHQRMQKGLPHSYEKLEFLGMWALLEFFAKNYHGGDYDDREEDDTE